MDGGSDVFGSGAGCLGYRYITAYISVFLLTIMDPAGFPEGILRSCVYVADETN